MCVPGLDPITLIGIGANVAGAALNAKTQNDAIEAQNAENRKAMDIERRNREAERLRQREMEGLQREAVDKAAIAADGGQIAEDVEAQADDPSNQFVAVADEYNVPMLQGQVADGEVSQGIGKIVGDALKNTREILKNQSTLVGQNTAFGTLGDVIMRMGADVSNVGSDRRGSLGVAQMETSIPAAEVTRSDSIMGDLLMMGGSALSGYGGRTAGMAARAPAVKTAPVGSIFSAPLVPSGYTPLPSVY